MSRSRTGCANDHYHGRTIIDISISRRLFGHDEKKKDEKSKTLYDLIWEAAFCLYLVFTTCFGPQLKRQSNTVFSAEGRGLFMRSISLTRVPLAGRLQVEKNSTLRSGVCSGEQWWRTFTYIPPRRAFDLYIASGSHRVRTQCIYNTRKSNDHSVLNYQFILFIAAKSP